MMGAMASKKARSSSPVSRLSADAEGRRGEGSRRDDHLVPLRRRKVGNFLRVTMLMSGWLSSLLVTSAENPFAVDRERTARRHLMRIGCRHDERARPAHLLMQQADGVRGGIIAAKRIGTDELGQSGGLMSIRLPMGTHLMDDRRHACAWPPARPLPPRQVRPR